MLPLEGRGITKMQVRYLSVIYVPEAGTEGVFVIAAYELTGKPLLAYRKRHRRRGQT